ncbi:GerMN domain-containing protein [Gloeocapsopsis dulcis]|uniref:Spore germination protein n=1 Tax=Gloeocapsopsis dulcis AAB1 = 1H9 TaxID=1433147 RepID=A0A6N8FQ07_9CHRO|nr:GerMN domain-containing protein [Gloeocapsopsis dulcis]MUL35191.1 spore germination protein [Gloeocapsopsis dulcis AAB1 = 1H9]WNN89077.1 GerMN domain-containing protein [Gloeocapsopsis dulcis]
MTQERAKRVPAGVIASVIIGVLAAGGTGTWWAFRSAQIPNSQQAITTPNAPSTNPSVQPGINQTAQVYWLRDTGTQLEVVPTAFTINSSEPNVVLQTAFEQLLAGPTNNSVSSTIPQGTKLRSVRVQNDGVHVDLSSEFTSGGGSASMTGRLAQVVYTATTIEPNAQVWIDVEGQKLEYLGGEGIMLNQPLTRQSVKENFQL